MKWHFRPGSLIILLLAFLAGQQGNVPHVWGQEEKSLDTEQFQHELARLARICTELNLTAQGNLSENWIVAEQNQRDVLYLPVLSGLWTQPVQGVAERSWAKHFLEARSSFANTLTAQLPQLAKSDEQAAYRQLWQVLREDPNQPLASATAGTLASGLMVRPRLSTGRVPIPELGWEARSYSRVDTPHFTLLSHSSAKDSRSLAEQLEQFYVLWTQVFYPYWAQPGLLSSRLSGQGTPWPRHERMKVVLLKDREEYVRVLGGNEQNIGVSVGYYNPSAKMSFFYPAENLDATLFHELTHQLWMEATSFPKVENVAQEGGIWMVEGIALYMESLRDRQDHWILGGWEAPRLQTARYRGVRDGFWPDWQGFSQAGLEEWKQDPAIARLYSHAVGVTHVLLNHSQASRQDYLRNLVGIYQGQNDSRQLLQHLAGPTGQDGSFSQDQAKVAYQDQLIVQESQVLGLPESEHDLRDLVLAGSQFQVSTWEQLEQFEELEWLDVSFSNVRDASLSWLGSSKKLRRLSVEGTGVSGAIMPWVATLPGLQELDVSGCPLDTQALGPLQSNRSLEILWLTQTKVSDKVLAILASMPNLSQVDISGTDVDAQAWADFVRRNPRFAN